MDQKKKKYLTAALLLLFVIGSCAVCLIFGKKITELASDLPKFREWVEHFGWKSRLVFVGLVCVQVIFALIPGEPLELAAGYIFGSVEGTLLCLIGIALGSMLVFGLVRRVGTKVIRVFFPEEKIEKVMELSKSRKSLLLWAILMLLPGTPKDLLTYCAGLTKIPWGIWFLLGSVGRLPSVITSTVCADELSRGNYLRAGIIFAVTAVLCLGGILVYSRIGKKKEEK